MGNRNQKYYLITKEGRIKRNIQNRYVYIYIERERTIKKVRIIIIDDDDDNDNDSNYNRLINCNY